LKGKLRTALLGLAVAGLGLGTAGVANADDEDPGIYHQSVGPISCRGNIHGGEGGWLSARVSGYEQRSGDDHMETAALYTRLFAQRRIDAVWHRVKVGALNWGELGPSHKFGQDQLRAPYVWPGRAPDQNRPRFHIDVSVDGTYRLVIVTTNLSAEGAVLARSVGHVPGVCTVE